MAQANDIALAAQEEVERHFDSWIQGATRQAADLYHPGAFRLASVLGDQSGRALDNGQRMGWTSYWMTLDGVGQQVLDTHHVLEDRDGAEFNRVLQLYALDPANRSDIDDAIHSWPAEAGTGTVFIQPFADPAADTRTIRWDLFTTLIHEMMHKVAHPNFERTAQAIGGSAQKYMTEGFADLMRHDLWDGAGGLRAPAGHARGRGAAAAGRGRDLPLRRVEDRLPPGLQRDRAGPPDPAPRRDGELQGGVLPRPHRAARHRRRHGRDDVARRARGVADLRRHGRADLHVAGRGHARVDLGPHRRAGALAAAREPARHARRRRPRGGSRIAALGIRYVRAIQGDTLGTVARQNGVTVAALAAANGFPAAAPDSTALAAGRRLMIPRRP